MRSSQPCAICSRDSHLTLQCPDLPIVHLGRSEAPLIGFRSWKPRVEGQRAALVAI
jgi:hypothetical protein